MTICPRTGLAVPECSCRRCLEAQLRRFHPASLRDGGEKPRRGTGGNRRGDGRLAA
jgi:hypothetical protein